MADLNARWKRDFDVCERIDKLGIDLKTKDEILPDPVGRRIAMLAFTPCRSISNLAQNIIATRGLRPE